MPTPRLSDAQCAEALRVRDMYPTRQEAADSLGISRGALANRIRVAEARLKAKPPKILIYDIETSPLISYTWGTFKQNVIKVIQESHILCFAYKWLGEDKTHIVALPQFKGQYKVDPTNDVKLIEKLHSLFDEADIVIAHNGDRFDQRKSKARFLVHGLKPPSPFRTIDTLKVARKHFALHSKKLDALGEILGVGRKVVHTGFSLWEGCMNGDEKSWQKMMEYNVQDVNLLEAVYYKLQGWIDNHPNLNVYSEGNNCPVCKSTELEDADFKYTNAGKYPQYHCKSCGRYSTGKSMVKGSNTEVR